MSKDTFKEFIKKRPDLAKAVFNGKVSFQKLYEAYDIYGEDSNVFDKYLVNDTIESRGDNGFSDITNIFKNLDLDTIQKGVNGLQKAVNLIQEIVPNNTQNNANNYVNYEERPINKFYED